MSVPDPTRTRLLEAAGEEFASKGFEAARVRSICRKAGANPAAINYHFGDKERLYVEAVIEAHRCGGAVLEDEVFEGKTPAEQLKVFVAHFLQNVLAVGDDTWHRALMLREMLQPSSACESLVREAIRPRFVRLIGILHQACPEADGRRLHALAFSVIGQGLYYKMARPVTERLIGREGIGALGVEFLTDHITAFTLAAIGLGPPSNGSAGVHEVENGTLTAQGR